MTEPKIAEFDGNAAITEPQIKYWQELHTQHIYVLRLEQGKFYVGRHYKMRALEDNKRVSFAEHLKSVFRQEPDTPAWTRQYKPLGVILVLKKMTSRQEWFSDWWQYEVGMKTYDWPGKELTETMFFEGKPDDPPLKGCMLWALITVDFMLLKGGYKNVRGFIWQSVHKINLKKDNWKSLVGLLMIRKERIAGAKLNIQFPDTDNVALTKLANS